MKLHSIRSLLILGVLLATTSAAITGCTRIPRQRTLPPSVRAITVPMFVNRSAEPQIEEDATVYTQEEFLADGRLNLVRREKADAIVEVTITEFVEDNPFLDSDDLPRTTRYTMQASIVIKRNVPGLPTVGGPRTVIATSLHNSDKRQINFEPEPVGKERALREFARQIVREVITGEYQAVEYLPPPPGAIESGASF